MRGPKSSDPKVINRLTKELQDTKNLEGDNISLHPVGNDIFKWKGYIKGPEDTPYAGGNFILAISIPKNYPYSPPKINFETKIWHPNISSQTGAICLDILKDEWSPANTMRTALLSIQLLLSAPEPDSPQDAEVANMYKRSIEEFKSTATAWTNAFAKNVEETQEEKVGKLVEMGFKEDKAREALRKHNWDETLALDSLFG